MPKSMLTTSSHADMGRCKRKRDARGSSSAMGCHGCRGTRPNHGQERLPLGLPNGAQTGPPTDGTPHNQKGGWLNANGCFSKMAAPKRCVFFLASLAWGFTLHLCVGAIPARNSVRGPPGGNLGRPGRHTPLTTPDHAVVVPLDGGCVSMATAIHLSHHAPMHLPNGSRAHISVGKVP